MVNIRQINDSFGDSVSSEYLAKKFETICEEFDDHLTAINENTLEIKDNHERIMLLDQKIDKLSSRLEETHFLLSEVLKKRNKFGNIKLSDEEQKVFLGIYTEDKKISYTILSKKLGLNRSTVRLAVNSIKQKEIPIFIQKEGTETYAIMDSKFRELQATEQLIKLDEKNVKNLFVRDLRYFF